ncbi:SusC/RagA family TonB-linked outer membrane protein [Phocaeicola coprocola]|jgi:TonB-linked SusC/RagA family outer membrane protein|uniref:TonB-dependent receptor n=1 Tax=Phocaeicola coprocola TaxID=310298 RepID=A0A412GBG2_9BACT|nr:TonB-dependent receptor [Phocaeicola coprocola]RGR92134.1 TonB-dependent receptor [Phocaeicola coprocola]
MKNKLIKHFSIVSFILMILCVQNIMAQKRTVSGIVTDSKNEPLIGVNVTIKNASTTGTITDIDGKYSLEIPSGNSVLVFSYIGYSTQEVKVSNQSVVDIVLKDDMQALEEVVVVGYGTMKKSDLTGSVSSITSDNFKLGTDLTPQQLMQGAFSGVNISQNSGKPGGSNTIRVRGGTSITASNDPLYVIDGVPISTSAGVNQSNIGSSTTDFFDQEPINPLSNINPNDIESINILKDASATAIYGSRGANGVIMITTKKGKAGMRQLDYSFNLGVSTVAKKLDVLTGDEYRKTVSELGLTLDDKGQNTDWQDVIFRTAISQNHYVSFMSGSENTSYRASAGYSNQNGVMEGSGMKSANARMNINHKALNDKLKLNMNISYGETNSDQAPVSNTVGSEMGSSMLYEAYVFNPTYPIYNEEGDYYDVPPYRVNPASFSKELLDERATSQFLGNLTADWNFYKPFTLQVNAGYNKNTINRNSYISKSNLLGNGNNGYVTVQKLSDYSKLLETILKYNQSFGKHNIDAMVGYSWQYFYSEGQTTKAYGFLSDNFKWYSLAAAQTVESVSSYAESNTLISMYGRINYNYADKYLLTATVRRDGSSRFGSGNKWGIFPSVAASWRISQEDFFQNDIMSDLKLRASFGITGSQEIGNYNSLSTLGASTNGYLVGGEKITIVLPQQYTNPDLKWEQTAQTDIGIDFGFLNGKIRGSIDYYYKKTTDLLLSVAVPSPSLITTQIANVGTVTNQGIELDLSFDLMRTKNFAWDANLNLSHNKNEVVSLSNGQWTGDNMQVAPCQGQGLSGTYAQLIMPGQPIGTFYGKRFIGVVDGVEQFANDGEPEVIGCAQPDLTFGLGTNLQYKNWTLSLNFRGSIGNDVYNCTANNLAYLSNLPGRNVLKEAVTSGVNRDQAKVYSSRFIEDGSFVRLDNLSLGYNFSLPKLYISNARVFVSAQNLFVITGYSGADPEVNSEISRTGVAPLGVDYLSYPKARIFSMGINLSF